MAINFGILDTSLPEKIGALPANALAGYLRARQATQQMEEAGSRNALAKMQLTRGQRDMAEEDAYRNALAGVQNGDYAAAMPDLMKASPTRALALRKSLAEEQRGNLETTLKRFEVIGGVASQFAANPTRQMGVWAISQMAALGYPKEVTDEASAKLNSAKDVDIPKIANGFLAATQEGVQAKIAEMYPKPTPPTDLGRLLAERDAAVKAGDAAAVAAYDAAINKETTKAPPSVTPYFTFLPSGAGYLTGNNRTGEVAPVTVDGKVPYRASDDPALQAELAAAKERAKTTAGADVKRERGAVSALNILDEADQWIDKATSSYAGAARDVATRAVGASTEASRAAARLKVLQGALMMAQPRMEGPQSDKDVALYREMAGRLGDPTVPAAEKRAAVSTIRAIQEKYAPQKAGAAPAAAPASFDTMPPPGEHTGRTIRDSTTGVRYRSDGRSWVRVR